MKISKFYTKDFALQLVLARAGIPWADENFQCVRVFSNEYLQKHGCRTVAEAEEAGFTGDVQWGFERTPELDAIVEDFNRIYKGEENPSLELPDLTPRQIGAFVSLILRDRRTQIQNVNNHPPKWAIKCEGTGRYVFLGKDAPKGLAEAFGVQE